MPHEINATLLRQIATGQFRGNTLEISSIVPGVTADMLATAIVKSKIAYVHLVAESQVPLSDHTLQVFGALFKSDILANKKISSTSPGFPTQINLCFDNVTPDQIARVFSVTLQDGQPAKFQKLTFFRCSSQQVHTVLQRWSLLGFDTLRFLSMPEGIERIPPMLTVAEKLTLVFLFKMGFDLETFFNEACKHKKGNEIIVKMDGQTGRFNPADPSKATFQVSSRSTVDAKAGARIAVRSGVVRAAPASHSAGAGSGAVYVAPAAAPSAGATATALHAVPLTDPTARTAAFYAAPTAVPSAGAAAAALHAAPPPDPVIAAYYAAQTAAPSAPHTLPTASPFAVTADARFYAAPAAGATVAPHYAAAAAIPPVAFFHPHGAASPQGSASPQGAASPHSVASPDSAAASVHATFRQVAAAPPRDTIVESIRKTLAEIDAKEALLFRELKEQEQKHAAHLAQLNREMKAKAESFNQLIEETGPALSGIEKQLADAIAQKRALEERIAMLTAQKQATETLATERRANKQLETARHEDVVSALNFQHARKQQSIQEAVEALEAERARLIALAKSSRGPAPQSPVLPSAAQLQSALMGVHLEGAHMMFATYPPGMHHAQQPQQSAQHTQAGHYGRRAQ